MSFSGSNCTRNKSVASCAWHSMPESEKSGTCRTVSIFEKIITSLSILSGRWFRSFMWCVALSLSSWNWKLSTSRWIALGTL